MLRWASRDKLSRERPILERTALEEQFKEASNLSGRGLLGLNLAGLNLARLNLPRLDSSFSEIRAVQLTVVRFTLDKEGGWLHPRECELEIIVKIVKIEKKVSKISALELKSSNKGSLPNAFSTYVYSMQLQLQRNYIGWLEHRNYFENANTYSKRTLKSRVATRNSWFLVKNFWRGGCFLYFSAFRVHLGFLNNA